MAICSFEYDPKSDSGKQGEQKNQKVRAHPRIEDIKDHTRQPSVSDVWIARKGKGPQFRSWNSAGVENVLSGLEVKPEVGIIN